MQQSSCESSAPVPSVSDAIVSEISGDLSDLKPVLLLVSHRLNLSVSSILVPPASSSTFTHWLRFRRTVMDLSSPKLTDNDRLSLCRKYFIAGFACLPFLWFVNAVWFSRQAFFRKPGFPEQKAIRRYVVLSGFGSLVWLIALLAWFITYVQNRQDWGEFGDRISFNVPLGQP